MHVDIGSLMPMSATPDDFDAIVTNTSEDDCMYGGVFGTVFKYTWEDGPFKRLRVCIDCKTPQGVFPIAFICDTCAPSGLYLCRHDMKKLTSTGQLDDNMTIDIHCDDGPMAVSVQPTPNKHEPANLIGLHTLMRLGLRMNVDTFSFIKHVKWIGGRGFSAPAPNSDALVQLLTEKVARLEIAVHCLSLGLTGHGI